MKHNHSCLQTGAAVAVRQSVSPAATPAIQGNLCGSKRANVPSGTSQSGRYIAGGLDDVSRGFHYAKIWFRPKMANINGWMIYPWMI